MFQSLLNFNLKLKISRKIVLKELHLLSMIGYCRKKKQKYSVLKKVERFLKNKTNNPLQVYEIFYNGKPYGFIEHQCNEVDLKKGILDIFLATWKSNMKFSLQLTNGIVHELYHFIIFQEKLTWKIFVWYSKYQKLRILFHLLITKKKCRKVKNVVNAKSRLIAKLN